MQEVTVVIQGDDIDELDEVFLGQLERVTDARIAILPDRASITIIDDDSMSQSVVCLAAYSHHKVI